MFRVLCFRVQVFKDWGSFKARGSEGVLRVFRVGGCFGVLGFGFQGLGFFGFRVSRVGFLLGLVCC